MTMRNELESKLHSVLQRFTAWLSAYGETSHDYQSYYAGPLGGAAKELYYRHAALGTLAVAPMVLSEAFFPAGRRFFSPKLRFPIADAHYSMGFSLLYQSTGDQRHYERAAHYAQVLKETRSPGYERYGWGYPFNWVTRGGIVPAHTPLITSTPYAYETYDLLHQIDGDAKWLEIMQSIAEHARQDIRDFPTSPSASSCGYSPLEGVGGVVNASAYRAFLLTSASVTFRNDSYGEIAGRNLNYVLDSQNEDGSWYYATDGERNFIDHFHTCFVLKALGKIEKMTGHQRCGAAIDRGLQFYVDHLFDPQGQPTPFFRAPRLTVYRQELYDYAECINLCVLLKKRSPVLDDRLGVVLQDLFSRWQKADGSFRSRKLMLGWDNVPMHRWGQSQIFRSLCLLLREQRSSVRE
jgi:hypothetical protein